MTQSLPTAYLDTASLLTAIPGLFGFRPEHSMVVVAFDADASIAVTARHDVELESGEPTARMRESIADVAAVCLRTGAVATAVVVADDRHALDSPVYRRLVAEMNAALVAVGVPGGVSAGFVLAEFAQGQPWRTMWWELDGPGPRGCDPAVPHLIGVADPGYGCGLLGDPKSSPVALERSLTSGRVVMDSRGELADSLAGTDQHCTDLACGGRPRRPRVSASRGSGAALLRSALDLLTGPEPPEMTCATVSLLGRALIRLDVRDALMTLGAGEHRYVAETVWRELTRRTDGRQRASAATMLAHLYYLGGEGTSAGIALDVALAADPGWNLARLLDSALAGGVHPSMIWELLVESYVVGATLGVELPAMTPNHDT
ncbi:DUF4192 domain-containing protein [Gordonia sp. X0973]|uniref:DUF4192 domain-containing protein n=1 Tax=Gordonia sp. X0973 TaxID=2742602 RepID=UPI000F5256C3|nr:DUF4192 domain-containing protein [Gordonia sp. X0973]QKT07469.1 DUF4192 domain-containing protein [Gordonia sp. X0973]